MEVYPHCKRLHYFPRISHTACHVHDGFVADDVGKAVNLSEELRLSEVYVFSLPEPSCHHRSADIHQDAPGQHASESFLDGGVHLLELPLQVAQVAFYDDMSLLLLCFNVQVHWYSYVLDLSHAWDSCNTLLSVLSEYL